MAVYYRHTIESPIGELTLVVDRKGRACAVAFGRAAGPLPAGEVEDNKYACGQLAWELDEYFAGKRQQFTMELSPQGSDFQRSIWSYLLKVPYGETLSYGELARKSGRRGAARVVASAVAGNPLPILIPCHRVVPASGGVGRYALRHLPPDEGTRIKSILIGLEAEHRPS